MKVLIIINDAPYGSERAYNALRLAGSLAKREGVEVCVFLVGDGASWPRVARNCHKVITMRRR